MYKWTIIIILFIKTITLNLECYPIMKLTYLSWREYNYKLKVLKHMLCYHMLWSFSNFWKIILFNKSCLFAAAIYLQHIESTFQKIEKMKLQFMIWLLSLHGMATLKLESLTTSWYCGKTSWIAVLPEDNMPKGTLCYW